MLINQFGDIWFQDSNLLEIYEEAMPLYRKFFEGPKVMRSVDHSLIEKGDLDLATYVGPKDEEGRYDADLVFATKNFRKLNNSIYYFLIILIINFIFSIKT